MYKLEGGLQVFIYLSAIGYWKVGGQRYRSAYAAARLAHCKQHCSEIQEQQTATLSSTLHNGQKEDSLGLCLSIRDLADEDGILWMADVSFLKHVGGSNCKHGTIIVEGQWCNTGRVPVKLTQALLVEWVPDVHKAIRATWWKDRFKVILNSLRPRYCWDMDLSILAELWMQPWQFRDEG